MSAPLRGAIVGVGSYAPSKVLSNQDLEKLVDTSHEWILKRTGIRERRMCSDGESTATMGLAAAKSALDDAGITADQVDIIICATVSPELIFPATHQMIMRQPSEQTGSLSYSS